ncbi:hypothetical protein COHA_003540 [Chlorella ohadii]|uniref:Mannosyltransferase n=1 Tax=Chlorella ohadii TaxID=2649997 RepID=A0AAD5H3C9_9CHLO|nr:hypothetical protein COHA_003540 [Chlorella ohadii]
MLRQRTPHREGARQEGGKGRTPRPGARRAARAGTASTALPATTAFVLLALARLGSAALNIIHDCDETFNYLEPLHYFLHGSGMQTWEYSAQFALRSWLYLLLHAPAAGAPALLGLGAGRAKLLGFFLLRAALGLVSAATEAWLYRAVAARYRPALAHCLLLFLCGSSGLFAASTAMLPSSFTMYALTAAAAGMLEGRPYAVILAAAVGVVWGWCVAGFAFLPYALWVLAAAPLLRSVGWLVLCLAGTLGPLVLVDRHFYGAWTASLWNFVRYNVVGGGDSALYGVEDASFYLRNALNNFQFLLPLALLFPVASALAGASLCLPHGSSNGGAHGKPGRGRTGASGSVLRLLVCVAPIYVWGAAITALPHKEERFLYVVYPLICLAAAASFVALCSLAGGILGMLLPRHAATAVVQLFAALFLLGSGLLAFSRSAALVVNYGAPLRIYQHLPEVEGSGPPISVCTGAEWHRFPSAFFLPGQRYRLQFIKSGFDGLLPHQFDDKQGGTRAAPPYFNDRNQEEPANYWPSAYGCHYVVTLRDEQGALLDTLAAEGEEGAPAWQQLASLPFVDQARSPPLFRAFYVPGLSAQRNRRYEYVLLRRKDNSGVQHAEGQDMKQPQ